MQSYQQGCVDVYPLDERLTLDEVDAFRPLLAGALAQRLPQVVIDLRRVRLIDSAGLELLCEIQSACIRRGGAMRLAAPSALLLDVLRVTGLDEEFDLHQDVVTAAGAFAR